MDEPARPCRVVLAARLWDGTEHGPLDVGPSAEARIDHDGPGCGMGSSPAARCGRPAVAAG
ncbi:hypothetical protein [Kibdelosporangium philippinense]|uniref:hypothetical protein n=1 Tax=Kibdelosporangium philippinense TaxID=211113 RepID=UPI00361C0162